jgi:hypothetical protein
MFNISVEFPDAEEKLKVDWKIVLVNLWRWRRITKKGHASRGPETQIETQSRVSNGKSSWNSTLSAGQIIIEEGSAIKVNSRKH